MWPKMLKTCHLIARVSVFFILFLAMGVSHAADTIKGGELYAAHCSICHGTSGISIMPDAPSFARNEGLLNPDAYILEAVNKGKNAMPSYLGILSNDDILNVIAYLRTLN